MADAKVAPAESLTPQVAPLLDRTAEMRWLKEHRGEHRRKHVALKDGRLVATADSLRELYRSLHEMGLDNALTAYIPAEEEEQFHL